MWLERCTVHVFVILLFWLEDLRQVGKRGRVAGWLAGWLAGLALNPLGAEPWVWFLSLFEFRVLC